MEVIWSDTATNQGMPRNARRPPETRRGKKPILPRSHWGESNPADTLISDFWPLEPWKNVLSHPNCGNLSQQPQEMNAVFPWYFLLIPNSFEFKIFISKITRVTFIFSNNVLQNVGCLFHLLTHIVVWIFPSLLPLSYASTLCSGYPMFYFGLFLSGLPF